MNFCIIYIQSYLVLKKAIFAQIACFHNFEPLQLPEKYW